jgi:metal-responsive CopG/Arc/MetJ family transcriptional regulator
MTTVRTSITMDAELFKRSESAAEKLGVSRSSLFAIALREFLAQEENRLLLQRLNMVADKVPPDERAIPAGMKRRHREIVMSDFRRRRDDASADP